MDVTTELLMSLGKALSIVLLGYILRATKIIDGTDVPAYNKFVRLVCFPAVIFISVIRVNILDLNWPFIGMIALAKSGVSFFTFVFLDITSTRKKLSRSSHGKVLKESVLHAFSSTTGNEIAVGMPLVLELMPTFFPLLVIGLCTSFFFVAPVVFAVEEVLRRRSAQKKRDGGKISKSAVRPLAATSLTPDTTEPPTPFKISPAPSRGSERNPKDHSLELAELRKKMQAIIETNPDEGQAASKERKDAPAGGRRSFQDERITTIPEVSEKTEEEQADVDGIAVVVEAEETSERLKDDVKAEVQIAQPAVQPASKVAAQEEKDRGLAYAVFKANVLQNPAFPVMLITMALSLIIYRTDEEEAIRSHAAFKFFDGAFVVASNGFGILALISLGASAFGISKRMTRRDFPVIAGMTVWRGCALSLVLSTLALFLPSNSKYFITDMNDTVTSIGDVREDLVAFSGLYGAIPITPISNVFARHCQAAEDITSALIVVSTLFSSLWMTFLIMAARDNLFIATIDAFTYLSIVVDVVVAVAMFLFIIFFILSWKGRGPMGYPIARAKPYIIKTVLISTALASIVSASFNIAAFTSTQEFRMSSMLKGISEAVLQAELVLLVFFTFIERDLGRFSAVCFPFVILTVGSVGIEMGIYFSRMDNITATCDALSDEFHKLSGVEAPAGYHLIIPTNVSYNGDLRCTELMNPALYSTCVMSAVIFVLLTSGLIGSLLKAKREAKIPERAPSKLIKVAEKQVLLPSSVFSAITGEVLLGSSGLSFFVAFLQLIGVRLFGPLALFFAFDIVFRRASAPILLLGTVLYRP